MLKQLFCFFSLFFVLFFFPFSVRAADDFKIIYTANYQVDSINTELVTNVDFQIQVINLRSDIYIKKFSLSFPKSFTIKNLKVRDDTGEVVATSESDNLKTKIDLEFNHPLVGKGLSNNFYLKYTQDNLFKNSGAIWEMILPVIADRENAEYKVIVTLPEKAKKLSLAKPLPTKISGNQIIWENPPTKTLYGIFGEEQVYQTELTYHLKNPDYTFVYTDIALPPDMTNQKVYLSSLDPEPKQVFTDVDGNYLARYVLKPSEEKTIVFSGYIQINSNGRNEVRQYLNKKILDQEKYLLNQTKYWKLSNVDKFAALKNTKDIFNYVISNLDYNYARINEKNNRLGAEKALASPEMAVCVEYSDTLVAIAREKGIYTRELQGYAFSQEADLRPISLTTDILHSWVEYYDKNKKIWVQIDPTWEDTSGIDYFNSLDLNHLVFAIHGKQDDYPSPAGMYKTTNSRDILIRPSKEKPNDNIKIDIGKVSLPGSINDKDSYKFKLAIFNKSNIFLYNIPLDVRAEKITFDNQPVIDVLAPLEKKEFEIIYHAKMKNVRANDKIQIFIENSQLFSQEIKIVPYVQDIAVKVAAVIAGITIIYLVIRIKKKH